MRILFMGHDYTPHVTGIGPYTTGLAEWLAGLGHEVWAATTFPYYPQWETLPEYRGRLFQDELIGGVHVRRTPVLLPSGRRQVLRRVLFDSSLATTSFPWILVAPRFDVIVCVSPPLQLAAAAEVAGWIRRTPVIVHVQDLVPDAALAVGMLKPGRAVTAARALERWVYDHAAVVSVISEGFRSNILAKGVPEGRVALNPNWVDVALFDTATPADLRRDLSVPARHRLVLHTGSIQEKQGLETVVEAAAHLKDDDVTILIVGEGQVRRGLEALASRRSPNVRFLPLQADFPATLAAADALLLCQRAAVVDAVAPSKLLAYMAAGRPVVASVNLASEAARLVEAAHAGVVVTPEDPKALAGAIRTVTTDHEGARRFGTAGRAYAGAHFDREAALHRWIKMLEGVVHEQRFHPAA